MPSPNLGRLKNGNTPAPITAAWEAPRCGARCKRTGEPCRAPAMPNGRCRLHGGKSTGPRTPEGIRRIKEASTVHGDYAGPDGVIQKEPGYLWKGHNRREANREAAELIRIINRAYKKFMRYCG